MRILISIYLLLCVGLCAGPSAPGGSFVETTKSYRPADITRVTSLNERQRNAHAWRGERVNWQILLWTGGRPVRAVAAASDLTSADGKLPAKHVRLDFLKFICMNTRDRYATDPAWVEMAPDMLNGPGPVDIAADHLQPLWVGVDIPRNAKPGLYRGDITVIMDDTSLAFPFAIKVLPVVVPEVKNWTFDVNFWMHPQATAHYYSGCECHGQDPAEWKHGNCAELMWSDRHLALYKPTLELTCYDEATGKELIHPFKSWDEYHQAWSSFMQEFVPLLVKNGWFERTLIGADQRGLGNMGQVQKVLEQFKHKGKALRISAAANRTHSFDDSLDTISMHGGIKKVVNDKWSEKQFADWSSARRTKGLRSTWYTCTGTYPGNFGNSRPAESLFIGWYSAHLQADGYLRWAVDSWNDTPRKRRITRYMKPATPFSFILANVMPSSPSPAHPSASSCSAKASWTTRKSRS